MTGPNQIFFALEPVDYLWTLNGKSSTMSLVAMLLPTNYLWPEDENEILVTSF